MLTVVSKDVDAPVVMLLTLFLLLWSQCVQSEIAAGTLPRLCGARLPLVAALWTSHHCDRLGDREASRR